jgi:flagellar basal body-associated protein FliL
MAIMVEQDKKPVNWINVIAIVVFIVLVFAVAYFIFFNKPQLIDVVLPGNLKSINTLSQVQIDPTPVVQSLQKYFTTNYGSSLTIPTPGRTNPFTPF